MPPRPLVLPLLLALSLSPVHAASLGIQTTGDDTTLETAIVDSITQAHNGDTVGALVGFERAFAAPDFAQLPTELRLRAWKEAAQTATNARQPADAQRYLQAALALAPDDPDALYLMGRLLLAQQQPAQALPLLTRAIQAGNAAPTDLDVPTVLALGDALQNQPTEHRALLQALFDKKWQVAALEPTDVWLRLATLQADAGDTPALTATVARIDTPMAIVVLRADKRFDKVIARHEERWDPAASALRYADALRVANLLHGESSDRFALELIEAQLMVGQHQAIIDGTEEFHTALTAPGSNRTFQGASGLATLMLGRARALHRLGRLDQVEPTLVLASELDDHAPVNTLQQLYLASWQVARDQPDRALQTLQALGDAPVPAEVVRQWVRFAVYSRQGDTARAAQARQWIETHPDQGTGMQFDVLLQAQDLDAAAAWVITRLKSPTERQETLRLLQAYRTVPPLPGDLVRIEQEQKLFKRKDVRRAIDAVGRIEKQSIYGRGAWQ